MEASRVSYRGPLARPFDTCDRTEGVVGVGPAGRSRGKLWLGLVGVGFAAAAQGCAFWTGAPPVDGDSGVRELVSARGFSVPELFSRNLCPGSILGGDGRVIARFGDYGATCEESQAAFLRNWTSTRAVSDLADLSITLGIGDLGQAELSAGLSRLGFDSYVIRIGAATHEVITDAAMLPALRGGQMPTEWKQRVLSGAEIVFEALRIDQISVTFRGRDGNKLGGSAELQSLLRLESGAVEIVDEEGVIVHSDKPVYVGIKRGVWRAPPSSANHADLTGLRSEVFTAHMRIRRAIENVQQEVSRAAALAAPAEASVSPRNRDSETRESDDNAFLDEDLTEFLAGCQEDIDAISSQFEGLSARMLRALDSGNLQLFYDLRNRLLVSFLDAARAAAARTQDIEFLKNRPVFRDNPALRNAIHKLRGGAGAVARVVAEASLPKGRGSIAESVMEDRETVEISCVEGTWKAPANLLRDLGSLVEELGRTRGKAGSLQDRNRAATIHRVFSNIEEACRCLQSLDGPSEAR